MSYFISPPEKTKWYIPAQVLAQELLKQWRDAEIKYITNHQSPYALAWSIEIGEWCIDGTLTKDGNVVNLDGDVRACAAFAIWFRSKIPIKQSLIFYDEGYSTDIALIMETTQIDLISPFLTS